MQNSRRHRMNGNRAISENFNSSATSHRHRTPTRTDPKRSPSNHITPPRSPVNLSHNLSHPSVRPFVRSSSIHSIHPFVFQHKKPEPRQTIQNRHRNRSPKWKFQRIFFSKFFVSKTTVFPEKSRVDQIRCLIGTFHAIISLCEQTTIIIRKNRRPLDL